MSYNLEYHTILLQGKRLEYHRSKQLLRVLANNESFILTAT